MSESKIVRGLAELVMKLISTKRIGKSVKWVFEPEILVKNPSQM